MAVEGCFQWTNSYACTAKQKHQRTSLSSGSQTTYCLSVDISESEIAPPSPPVGSQEDSMSRGHRALKAWAQGQVLQPADPASASWSRGQRMDISYALLILDTANESASYGGGKKA